MKFAKYWAKGAARDPASGRKSEIECWGWSDESLEHAAEVGRMRAERLAARLDFKNRPAAYIVQLVAAYHDRVTRAESGLPLA